MGQREETTGVGGLRALARDATCNVETERVAHSHMLQSMETSRGGRHEYEDKSANVSYLLDASEKNRRRKLSVSVFTAKERESKEGG